MKWTGKLVARVTQGEIIGRDNWVARRVSIDSRTVETGDLFIAIVGERLDGHEFVCSAHRTGAVAAIVSRIPDDAEITESAESWMIPLVVVGETKRALEQLAEYARRENASTTTFIGVTGSVGKTTTKAMLDVALRRYAPTYVTPGNYNNHFGLPLSIANMPTGVRFAVLELGMNHAGELKLLSECLRPDVAIITNVQPAHVGNFAAGTTGIADAKSDIFFGLTTNGVALLNRDDEFYDRLRGKLEQLRDKSTRLVTFGRHAEADVRLVETRSRWTSGLSCENDIVVAVGGTTSAYTMSTAGDHFILDSLATMAVLHALGLDIYPGSCALSAFTPPNGRGEILVNIQTYGGVEITVLDESYNASPATIEAALKTLGQLHHRGRKMAVLADMLELGEWSQQYHENICPHLLDNGIDVVFTIGENMRHLHDLLPDDMPHRHFHTTAELLSVIDRFLLDADLVLVKGSRNMKMATLVSYLRQQTSPYA